MNEVKDRENYSEMLSGTAEEMLKCSQLCRYEHEMWVVQTEYELCSHQSICDAIIGWVQKFSWVGKIVASAGTWRHVFLRRGYLWFFMQRNRRLCRLSFQDVSTKAYCRWFCKVCTSGVWCGWQFKTISRLRLDRHDWNLSKLERSTMEKLSCFEFIENAPRIFQSSWCSIWAWDMQNVILITFCKVNFPEICKSCANSG